MTPSPADVEAARIVLQELDRIYDDDRIVWASKPGVPEGPSAALARHIALARAEEREACAKALENEKQLILDLVRENPMGLLTPREISCAYQSTGVLDKCIDSIRARSEA